MDYLEILTKIAETVADNWAVIAGVIGLSALQTRINKWFHLQSDRVKVTITGLLSLFGVLIPASLGWLSANPHILGAYTATVFSGMTFAYRFIIKPTSNLISDAKTYRASVNEDATEVIEEPTTSKFPL